ncbi:EF hand [Novipirellula galeiformis]|uniref:EF hand n=1 Tax=Novipirellula galeiformis TaxID=2528004 RepID=A0A5C6C3E3_9BACT|nr:EF hand [Novipirellula galeiformis]
MYYLKTLVLVAVVGLWLQPVIADEQEQPAAETASKEEPSETNIERIRSEFEDLLIAQATDFSSPTATLAKMSNLSNKYLRADERFNQPIREVLLRYASSRSPDDSNGAGDLSMAVQMFELTTFPPEVAAELLFKPLLSEHPAIKDATRSQIKSLLSKRPDETSLLVLEALRRGERSPYVFSLTGITGEASEAVAGELLKIAKSGDAEHTPAALESLASVIDEVERFNQRRQAGLGSDTADTKLFKYARRIVARYDRNQDGSLTKDEYRSMLSSPEPADANQDGAINVAEYAKWLAEQRNR